MARFLLTALLVLFVVGQQGHAFYYTNYVSASTASSSSRRAADAKMAVFFREEALRVGQSLPFRFPAAVTAPLGLLPRHVADAIPFSSSALPGVLALLSVAEGSDQATRMQDTLGMCEDPGLEWEAKFCATSLEALVEGAQGVLGTKDVREMISRVPPTGAPLQPYAVRAVRPIDGDVFVGCHQKEYPYTVYMCHSTGPARGYEVEMEGTAGGGRVTLFAVCHTETSEWYKDHVAFRFLGIKPGGPPVCHVLPYGHILWAKKDSAGHSSA
ncbi:hypothetical protein HU200_033157 [Digitaria exilis]|uniref:BURP domain-containing protein n=1 Tax=Digitaria exilis TaxID=1010633 RepID=A0A835EN29_9POAL|nr:hypothetical protein HU200_033157 [Digitaria exilis]CAB3482804.1 unnamed protein product [Digitaria exilis]